MPLLKRKTVLTFPLPSLSSILQPLAPPPALFSDASTDAAPAPRPEDLLPPDGKDDEEQLERLAAILADPVIASRRVRAHVNGGDEADAEAAYAKPVIDEADTVELPNPAWKVKNAEVFYIPETGEMFLDYETYASRNAFYSQQLFQCEVSGKSNISFFKAQQSELKEVRQLHSRFPRQLKKAVLSAVQFQIEGKLENLADKVFERFHNRFFDEESETQSLPVTDPSLTAEVFVDVQGDKYLARVVRTFPPKNLVPPPSATLPTHPYATDLAMPNDEVVERDDPMKYFYNVRLIEEGAEEGIVADYEANGNGDDAGGERWMGSIMEVQADKISRDRINFSRAMLKRFIRDCVQRDAAVYSPWVLKRAVALRYGLPTEMSPEVREAIAAYRERQMEKRKRERDERLGLAPPTSEVEEVPEEPPAKKRRGKRDVKEEVEEPRRRKPNKYPAEDLLVDWSEERDAPAGRIEVRPAPGKSLPFGDQFEKFLTVWSFLNVMGKPLGLSSFTLDDFEHSLYHSDAYAPAPILVEIHAVLLNALATDLAAGHEPTMPLAHCGKPTEADTDYWEGAKGATTDTLRAACNEWAVKWKTHLSAKDGRKGWEGALVGCLWERATLESLPNFLDNLLHLTHEERAPPTRPTWSTAASSAVSATGLVPSKPEKRYASLHFLHKLDIVAFLVELVAQTAAVREFMEESTQALTEVRKDQAELKRELKRIQTERFALDPKPTVEANGDDVLSISIDVKPGSPLASTNGHAHEHDELESSLAADDHDDGNRSRASSPSSDARAAAGRRQRAMREKAAEREAEEAVRHAKQAADASEAKAKRAEERHAAAEKKRLDDEAAVITAKLRQLDLEFRSHVYTLRARPLGTDRFGNRVWWIDGMGSAPLIEDGRVVLGTGRVYVQGADATEVEMLARMAEVPMDEVEARRAKEEGEGRLASGEWAIYDTIEQVHAFTTWLNPRGHRDLNVARQLAQWMPEIEAGFKRRRIASGLEQDDEPRRARLGRRAAGDEERDGYMGWRNRRAE
ncbi:hypothetical protein Q5752_006715 [Cryptotrichosporon argae]